MDIQLLQPQHWPLIAAIYQEGIDTGHATFEAHPPAAWDEWIVSRLPAFCLGAWQREMLLGWGAFGPLAGQWRDVLLLERRSTLAGIE
jgi:phosphinothricin acetyltransferase